MGGVPSYARDTGCKGCNLQNWSDHEYGPGSSWGEGHRGFIQGMSNPSILKYQSGIAKTWHTCGK